MTDPPTSGGPADEECEHGSLRGTCRVCRPESRRKGPARAQQSTMSPKSTDDPIAALDGDKDISTDVHRTSPYLDATTDWLVASHGYPHHLRRGGWVYLRCDERLAARVRVVRMAGETTVPSARIAQARAGGRGSSSPSIPRPGRASASRSVATPSGCARGFGYHLTDRSGHVHHLTAGDPLPDDPVQ